MTEPRPCFRGALSAVTGVQMVWAAGASYSWVATQEHVEALVAAYGIDAVVDAFAEVYRLQLSRRISELRMSAVDVLVRRAKVRARVRDEARSESDIGQRVAVLLRAAQADGLALYFVPEPSKPGERHLVMKATFGAVVVSGSRGRRLVADKTLTRFADLVHWVEGRP